MIAGATFRISLQVKLIAAFALVVVLGSVAAYWLSEQAVREGFEGFRFQTGIIQAYELQQSFAEHYERVGSWRGIENFLSEPGMEKQRGPAMLAYHSNLILADEQGRVLLAPDPQLVGHQISQESLTEGVPINATGRRVGTLLVGSTENIVSPLEQAFLDAVRRSILAAGLLAAVAALLVGAVLLRHLTVPLRRLSQATEQMSVGNMSPRLPAHSHDELGQLSAAFNRMAERLEKSEKLRRQMIADIAHELRTPLTVIQGDLQAMLDGVYDPKPETLASIHEESILLSRLVSDLQELSLAEAGELHLSLQRTDLRTLVERVTMAVRSQLTAKQITLDTDLPTLPAEALVDPDRISQVLFNLLSNAQRHTPEGGHVTVCMQKRDPEAILVSVTDTGPGISSDDLPYVFERFWRSDKSRTRATGGSGLGLAIAKQLIEAHGGHIWVESQLTQGVMLTFSLPLAT